MDLLSGEFRVSKGYAKISQDAKHPFPTAFAEADKMLYAEKREKKEPLAV